MVRKHVEFERKDTVEVWGDYITVRLLFVDVRLKISANIHDTDVTTS